MRFFGLLFSLERLIDRLVGINDESDDDVDKDEIGQLNERNEVQDDSWIFFHVIDQLVHVDDLLPIVQPHETEKRVQRHNVVIEIQVQPWLINVVLIVCNQLVDLIYIDLTSKEFQTDTRIYEIERVQSHRKVEERSNKSSDRTNEVSPKSDLVKQTSHSQRPQKYAYGKDWDLHWVVTIICEHKLEPHYPYDDLKEEFRLLDPSWLFETSS